MIELKHVTKTFSTAKQDVHACKDITLTIQDGEIFGIIGFSGAGKSTLVRCINLLERPTSGQVVINGCDITQLKGKELRNVRKKIGMIFQHFNLMRSRTVFQNIAYSLKDSKLSKKEIEDKVNSLLDLIDLKDKKDAYPSQLSGGQKQRVAIARSLANDPDILLCDEATSALDPQTTHSILGLLKEVNQKLGITIVMITHEMAVIKAICDKVAVMENGEVVEKGSVLEIFSNPQKMVTRNFINSTSSISKVYELIEENGSLVQLEDHEQLILLQYSSSNAEKALISEVSRQYDVNANIIFGNVEIIEGSPLGSLVVIMGGTDENIEKSLNALLNNGVKVEVLKSC